MQLDLPENLSVRDYRLELAYTSARLNAVDETRHLAADLDEAAQKFAQLEEEEARLALTAIETQAMIETADDAWDDAMHAFQRRLLDLAGNSTDHALYRAYFAEIPSHVTTLSYAAEIMISKDLEEELSKDATPELAGFADRLAEKRSPLEAALRERTRLEVERAKFDNRVALAKALANKLRRITSASLEEIGLAKDRGAGWPLRFYRAANRVLVAADRDGVEVRAAPANGESETIATAAAEA